MPSNPSHKYWTVFCLNGKDGLKTLSPINEFTSGAPDVATCHQIYGTRKNFSFYSLAEYLKETASDINENG